LEADEDLLSGYWRTQQNRTGRPPLAAAAMVFLLIVQKMRQALTFLATIENDDREHENTGRHFDSGAADDFRGGLHGPDSDKRSAGDARGELNPPFTAFGGQRICFRWINFSG
jgi:hypothetical protein